MNIVCLDTNIVIWGIKGQATKGQEINIHRARYLLETLKSQKKRILIPSIVAAEAMVKVGNEKRAAFLAALMEAFLVAPFDGKAALIYPELWEQKKDDFVLKTLQAGPSRATVKADCMIAAIAISRNVETLYTTDKNLTNLANPHVPVDGLPMIPPEPLKLPIEEPTSDEAPPPEPPQTKQEESPPAVSAKNPDTGQDR